MSYEFEKIQGLIAGVGDLPVQVAIAAQKSGYKVICISLSSSNRHELAKYCDKIYSFGPGELQKIVDKLHENQVKQLTFIGKVSKGVLFRNPKLDKRAIGLIKNMKKLNDDAVMLTLTEELKKEGINVIDQTLFIKDLLVEKGVIGSLEPDENQKIDIEYGFNIAKEVGRLDLGQTVVVQNKMILAVEAIEGTDKAIERGCKLGNGKAVVVKVSKPVQDKRFDIPTVGVGTLKTMKKYGANVLAIEANETFIVERKKMIEFAKKNNMVIIAV
jgi:UDP-2,3-diacylglucosamine hydrolase